MKKILSISFILAITFSFSVCKKLDKEQQAFEDTVQKTAVEGKNLESGRHMCIEHGVKNEDDKKGLKDYIDSLTAFGMKEIDKCPEEVGDKKLLGYCIYNEKTPTGKKIEIFCKDYCYMNLEKCQKRCKYDKGKFYPVK